MDVNDFWTWFVNHNERLTMLTDLDDNEQKALLEELQQQLTAFHEGLTYDISEPSPTGRTLTFSAEGDFDLFRYVDELVEHAPELDWWDFVAFRQPKGKDLKVLFDKYEFYTRDMYFMQLENEAEPDVLGLRVTLSHPNEDEDQLVGVYVTIEALIGEFDCTTLVGYLETVKTPDAPLKEGYRPLDELPQFIEWFKAQRDR